MPDTKAIQKWKRERKALIDLGQTTLDKLPDIHKGDEKENDTATIKPH